MGFGGAHTLTTSTALQLLQTRSGPGGPTVSDLSAEVAAQVRVHCAAEEGGRSRSFAFAWALVMLVCW